MHETIQFPAHYLCLPLKKLKLTPQTLIITTNYIAIYQLFHTTTTPKEKKSKVASFFLFSFACSHQFHSIYRSSLEMMDETSAKKPKEHENQQGGCGGGSSKKSGSSTATTRAQQAEQGLKCPRCDSPNTKFCYYNNYSLTQPRHFCKTCRRYWTKGGALRNVPIGGGCRKNKKVKSSRLSSSSCDSRDSASSSELGGLRFLHGLASSSLPSLDFHLAGAGFPFPTRLHHPNLFSNQFPAAAAAFGDLSANSASCNNSSCFNQQLDPNNFSLIGLNYPFSANSSSSGFTGANNAIMGMSSMNINSNIASSIESLSSMNQDLHWKLQQQRLAMLFGGGGGGDNNSSNHHQKDDDHHHHHQVVGVVEKPQPILFQNLEGSKAEMFNPSRKEGASSGGDNNSTATVTPTEWFFGNNNNSSSSYAASVAAPTPASNSGGGHDNAAATINWGGGVHATWGDVQHQYTALP